MLNTGLETNSTPRYFFDKITDITPQDLKEMGVRAVAIDIDNTTAYDSTYIIFKGVKEWIAEMKKAGIPVMVLTNTYLFRARIIAKKLGNLPFIGNAHKPASENYLKAAELCNCDISQFAMIGDQLFTDIRGANDAGAVSIRVHYTHREFMLAIRYRLLRRRENIYLKEKGFGDKI